MAPKIRRRPASVTLDADASASSLVQVVSANVSEPSQQDHFGVSRVTFSRYLCHLFCLGCLGINEGSWLDDFGVILVSFWDTVGTLTVRLFVWCHLGVILGSWSHLGVILVSFWDHVCHMGYFWGHF